MNRDASFVTVFLTRQRTHNDILTIISGGSCEYHMQPISVVQPLMTVLTTSQELHAAAKPFTPLVPVNALPYMAFTLLSASFFGAFFFTT